MQFSSDFIRYPRRCLSGPRRLLLCVILLSSMQCALSQSTGGRILGQVLDPSGAVIPGVTLTLTNANAGVSQTSTTNRTGEYTFNQVPVGVYQLRVQSANFQEFIADGIQVSVNGTVTYDIHLKIGANTQAIEVQAQPALVDTTGTQIGAVINERAVQDLPLNTRDTYQLLQLQPGVQGVGGSDLFFGSDKAGAVSVNGGRGRSNNFSVNGGDGNDLFVNSPGIEPSPDAVEEFRVITNTFDAEYGRNSGAVINVITKSGTNSMHGSIYAYVRNRALDSKGYFALTIPDDSQQQFGATVGGRIQKDKSFFFLSYEGRQVRKGILSDSVRVPTTMERAGVFSGGFSGSLTTGTVASILRDRCSAAISAAGGTPPDPASVDQGNSVAWSSIFPNGIIPPACFDPAAAALMQRYVPLPNVNGTLYDGAPLQHSRENQGTVRIDHNFNDHHTLTGFYYVDDGVDANPFTRFHAETPNLLPGFGSNNASRNQQINISETWVINPSTLNEARLTYYREGQRTFLHPQRTNFVTDSCGTGTPAAQYCFTGTTDTPLYSYDGAGNATRIPANPRLGITPGLPADHGGVPNTNISGGFTIGNDYEGELPQVGNTYSLTDNVSKTIGNHSTKFGIDFRVQHFDQTLYYNVNGAFSYSGGDNALGGSNYFPDYLLGLPTTYTQGSPQTENIRANALYLFAQDSYKIKPNITLNYGFRWELNEPLTDVSHRVQTFRPGQADTLYPCQLSADSQVALGTTDSACGPGSANEGVFPLGLVIPGDKGVPAGLTSTYYKAFAPRVGLSWSPESMHDRLVIRGGYGIFYNPMEQLVLEQFQGEPPFGGSSSVDAPLFDAPFVSQSGGITPNPFNGFLNPKKGQAIDWSAFRPIILYGELEPNLRSQYTEQYNFGIQQQISGHMVFNLGWVGSQGHRLIATYDLNHGDAQTCLDLAATAAYNTTSSYGPSYGCDTYGEDSQYIIPATDAIAPQGLHLPYGSVPFLAGGTPHGDINLVGLRKYSSPYCDPVNNSNCPADGVPVFSSIFAQNVVANSTYNSLQASLEKQFSVGLQFMAAYTFSKSIDNASSFEQSIDPTNFSRSRAVSLYDARNRFVFSSVWDLPVRKYSGLTGIMVNGWTASGIFAVQSGFPIRMQSNLDQELQGSGDFENPGKPDLLRHFQHRNPRSPLGGQTGYYFDPTLFGVPALGSSGNAPRSLCCGPGINNTDLSLAKMTPLGEGKMLQFTFQFFNIFNHTQFLNPDGQIGDAQVDENGNPIVGGLFGAVTRSRDPRQIQLAIRLKL